MKEQTNFFEEKLAFETDPSDLFDALNAGENIIVVDARTEHAYRQEHIPGAVHLPHRHMNESTTTSWDKNAVYAVYCDGVGCNASTKGSYNLSRLGFKVKEVVGGIRIWKTDGFATEGEKAFAGQKLECAC